MMSASAATYRNDVLAGKVALVVGGSSGIGAAIAGGLAEAGAVVTVTGATRDEVDAARAAPDFAGRDAIALDVRDERAVHMLIDDLPRLDMLVNCACVIRRDESKTLVVAEPLHGSCSHGYSPPGYVHCETRRVRGGNDCGNARHGFGRTDARPVGRV